MPPSAIIAAALLVYGPACGPGVGESISRPRNPRRTTSEVADAEVAERPPAASAQRTPGRLRYDLAAHVERAEIFDGEARVIDLTTTAGAKYISGGWLSSIRAGQRVMGEATGIVLGTRGRLQLPAESDGAAEIVLSVRAVGPRPLQVFVNDAEIAQLEVPTDRFATFSLPIAAGRLRRGDNMLILRTGQARNLPEVGRVGLLLRWVKIGPAREDDQEDDREDDREGNQASRVDDASPPRPKARLGSHPALAISEHQRLGYALEIPPNARLRGVVTGDGRLAVVVQRDDARPTTIATTGGGPFDLDLGSFAGELCRIDLEARGGDIVVGRPVVVTTDAREPRRSRSPPRNVLIYLIDTLRADRLRPYAPETRVRTPGLERFAASAATFTRGHAQENWTKPSVATLLSGLMPWQHTAVTGEAVLPRSVNLLPEMLKERGYYTGSFIANGYVSQAFGFRQGWDTYRNYIRENRRTDAEHVAADVLAWLDDRPEETPFLLYVHTIDPHVPYRPPNEYLRMYEETPYRGPLSFRRDATLLEGIKVGRTRTTAADRAHLEALYDGEISYHDVHFAAILDGLTRRGLDDDTLIVVTADHGEEFWDHGSVGHGHSVYEELLHVPMFMRLPGLGALRVEEPMGLLDVVPTVLDVLGHEIPTDLAGRSVLPELLGRDISAPPATVSGFMQNWRTIVVGRTKLIQRGTRRARLYDLTADPKEENDIAAERPIAVRLTRGLLGLTLSATDARPHRTTRRARHVPEETQIDAELEAQLEALGYVN